MTDYELDYTTRLERRIARLQAECDNWQHHARVRLVLIVVACAGWLATAVCK